MDILSIMEAGRRHWLLLTIGAVLGVLLAVLSAYKVAWTPGEGPRIAARTSPNYQTTTRLLITEPNLDVARMSPQQEWPSGYTKTVTMAPTYALLVLGDDIRRSAENRIGALNVALTADAVSDTPIIELTATGRDSKRVTEAARAVTEAFIAQLEDQQDERKVPQQERVGIRVLAAPSAPRQSNSNALEIAALFFLTPVLGSLAVAVSLERARERRLTAAYAQHLA